MCSTPFAGPGTYCMCVAHLATSAPRGREWQGAKQHNSPPPPPTRPFCTHPQRSGWRPFRGGGGDSKDLAGEVVHARRTMGKAASGAARPRGQRAGGHGFPSENEAGRDKEGPKGKRETGKRSKRVQRRGRPDGEGPKESKAKQARKESKKGKEMKMAKKSKSKQRLGVV